MKNIIFSKKSLLVMLIALLGIQANNISASFNVGRTDIQLSASFEVGRTDIPTDIPGYERDQFLKNQSIPVVAAASVLYCVVVPFVFAIPVYLMHVAAQSFSKS